MLVYDIQTESGTFLTRNVVVHNCYILGIDDDLVNEGGIFDGVVREARIFKGGSGSAQTFRSCERRARSLPAAARRAGLCRSSKSSTVPRARSNPAARRAAPRRWSCSTPIIPTSRSSSTGRCARNAKLPISLSARASSKSVSTRLSLPRTTRAFRSTLDSIPRLTHRFARDSRSDRCRRAVRCRAECARLRAPGLHAA